MEYLCTLRAGAVESETRPKFTLSQLDTKLVVLIHFLRLGLLGAAGRRNSQWPCRKEEEEEEEEEKTRQRQRRKQQIKRSTGRC